MQQCGKDKQDKIIKIIKDAITTEQQQAKDETIIHIIISSQGTRIEIPKQ